MTTPAEQAHQEAAEALDALKAQSADAPLDDPVHDALAAAYAHFHSTSKALVAQGDASTAVAASAATAESTVTTNGQIDEGVQT